VSPRGRHAAAWALALAACAGTVAGRVVAGSDSSSDTLALGSVTPAARRQVTTVTRTHTDVVTVPGRVRTVRVVERTRPARRAAASTPPAPVPAPEPARHPRPQHHASAPQHHRSSATQNVDGDAIPTRYGPVQIRLVMRARRILDVVVLKDPDDLERSRQIDADALPKLRAQVLAAQSAGIDGVSGATYTSQGYRQSVQSALDLA
jgi:uncharacterized protein with FMN-binding domain